MSNIQTCHHFKLDLQKVDQHIGGKWLIHGTKHVHIRYSKTMSKIEENISEYIYIRPLASGLPGGFWCIPSA